jgi:hypothetical protein|tara:strand:- start:1242 stop:1541 length:300 start_codon:yes stop_codon:yes gene_type:complete
MSAAGTTTTADEDRTAADGITIGGTTARTDEAPRGIAEIRTETIGETTTNATDIRDIPAVRRRRVMTAGGTTTAIGGITTTEGETGRGIGAEGEERSRV